MAVANTTQWELLKDTIHLTTTNVCDFLPTLLAHR